MSIRYRQIGIFAVGWVAYASTYFLRKPLGVIKADLEKNLLLTKSQLGWLDTALLFPYAVMQIALGSLGDRLGSGKTFGVCLVLACLSMVTFSHWDSFLMIAALLFFNGSAQALCWPNCTKVLLSWFSEEVRNSIFGMFGTCAFLGGVLGTGLAVYLQQAFGWRSVFFAPSLIVGFMGVLVLMFYTENKGTAGSRTPEKDKDAPAASKSREKIPLVQLCRIPMVLEVAVAVFCLKVVRYSMYMWLPMFLLEKLGYSQVMAGSFSTTFEIGGVLGSALIGLVLDRFFQGRDLVGTGLSILLSTLALVLFVLTSSWGYVTNALCLGLAGAFNAGPDTLLGGAIPVSLGERGNRGAGAATVGLVNGFGSVGTFLEGPVIGFVSLQYGWHGMFYLIIGLSALGTLAVFRAVQINKRTAAEVTTFTVTA